MEGVEEASGDEDEGGIGAGDGFGSGDAVGVGEGVGVAWWAIAEVAASRLQTLRTRARTIRGRG
jgi:hypothetical protein